MKRASDRFKNDQPITYVRKKNILFFPRIYFDKEVKNGEGVGGEGNRAEGRDDALNHPRPEGWWNYSGGHI